MRKYKISVKSFNDIMNGRGCYLKYNESIFRSMDDNNTSYNLIGHKIDWMFGMTEQQDFHTRNRQETRNDASVRNGDLKYALVIEMPKSYIKLFEDTFKEFSEVAEIKPDRKELYNGNISNIIHVIKSTINSMKKHHKDFSYEIVVIESTRYTEYLICEFGLKRNKFSKNNFNLKSGRYKHIKGFIVYYDDITNCWRLEDTKWMSFNMLRKILRSLNHRFTDRKFILQLVPVGVY